MRRSFFACLVGLTLLSLNFTQVWGLDKVRFGTSIRSARYELPLLAGLEAGFWKENKLGLEWISFKSGPDMFRGVSARSVDLALSTATTTIQSIARGIPVVIVAHTAAKEDFYIWVRTDSPIRGPRDLKGAKIGVTRFGGIEHAYGVMVAKHLGLEKELKLVAVGGVIEALAAIKAGNIDGRVGDYISTAPLKLKGEVRDVVSVKDYLPSPWIYQTISSRKDFAETSPETVRRAIRAFLQSSAYVLKNRQWTIDNLKSRYGLGDEIAPVIYEALEFTKDGRIDGKGVENARNFLVEYGIIKKDTAPPVEGLFTNKFAE